MTRTHAFAALMVLCACLGCNSKERQQDRDSDDQNRTGETKPRPENPQPTVAPNATDKTAPGSASNVPRPDTVGAGNSVAVASEDRTADADFKAAKGQKLAGEAEFEEVANGVKIVVQVENGPPGARGLHVHEKGDCSDIEGQSMGSHFAPKGEPHGLPAAGPHHLGDLGNLQIGKDGKGRHEIVVPGANLKEKDALSFLGRAIVIHGSKDTGAQPSGGAGKPIACGVIEKD